VLLGLGVLTVLRFAIAAWMPLGDDETFYWEWSRHLAGGYVDHPPAIAFLVWAATHLWGSIPFAVHGTAVVLSLLTSLALWVLAREVLGHEAGATWSVIVFNAIPVFAAGSVLAAPDAPLGLCWVMVLLWAWRAARGTHTRPWLAAGTWLGLAFDSKYTAAVLPLSVALWLAVSPGLRWWLRRPAPYLGLAVACVLFTPVVWWNATHRWDSFAYTLLNRAAWSSGGNFPTFVGLQFLYLAPLMFPVLLWALFTASWRGLRVLRGELRAGSEDRWLFLAASGVPLVIGVIAASLLGQMKPHWPAPGYITAAIALAGIATERPWRVRGLVWRGAAILTLGTSLLVAAATYALPALAPYLLPPALDPTVDFYGWPQATRQIVGVARRGARTPFFITTDRYQVLAQFDFASGGRYPSTLITGGQYRFWTTWTDLRGRDGLFIQDSRYRPDVDLNEGCRSLDVEPAVHIVRRGVVVRTLGLVWCRGFSGRPIPHAGRLRFAPGGPEWRLTRGETSSGAAPARGRPE
jgi:4-amino-4-deoxy-L-arabinose transferase-like glycosyltransferase